MEYDIRTIQAEKLRDSARKLCAIETTGDGVFTFSVLEQINPYVKLKYDFKADTRSEAVLMANNRFKTVFQEDRLGFSCWKLIDTKLKLDKEYYLVH